MARHHLTDIKGHPALKAAHGRFLKRYAVTEGDGLIALQCLAALFAVRRDVARKVRTPLERTFILPQIADWLWHELITDTVGYTTFARDIFRAPLGEHHVIEEGSRQPDHYTVESHLNLGGHVAIEHGEHSLLDRDHVLAERDHHQLTDEHNLLRSASRSYVRPEEAHTSIRASSHVGIRPGEAPSPEAAEAFSHSVTLLENEFGIDLSRSEWHEAGWERPAYRFSPAFRDVLDSARKVDASATKGGPDLSWITPRLVRRFGLSPDCAEAATAAYKAMALKREVPDVLHPHVYAAMVEHVLWTAVYERDCAENLGGFLHWPAYVPGQAGEMERWDAPGESTTAAA